MRFLIALTLVSLAAANDVVGSANDDSEVGSANDDSPDDDDSSESLDSQYCCMTHHKMNEGKFLAYVNMDSDDLPLGIKGLSNAHEHLQQLNGMFDAFNCQYVDGWSYCCPSGGEQTVLGNALCACNKSGRPQMQDCDDVEDWMEDVIKAKFGHSADSDWNPSDEGVLGVCDEKKKDKCGCCPGWGWDSDEYKCEYDEKTSRSDGKWCKSWDRFSSEVSDDGGVDSTDLDDCGCLHNMGWAWDSVENACEPCQDLDDNGSCDSTNSNDLQDCKEFLTSPEWVNFQDSKDDFPADFGGGGVGRRLLDGHRRLGIVFKKAGEPRDACGCIKGKQGWDDGKCKNNTDNDEKKAFTTDYEDLRWCMAMQNLTCQEEQKDECGCCPYWGWDDDTCEPGEITSDKDRRGATVDAHGRNHCKDSDENEDEEGSVIDEDVV